MLWFGLKICWYDEYRPSVPLNQRVHHRTERACSWIETVYCFSVYTYRSESYIGLCLSFEPLRQIQRSNIAYQTGGSVGQRFWTELIMNQCVYQSNHWNFQFDMIVKVKVNTLIWLMNRSFIIWQTGSIRYDSQSESKHANLIDEPLVNYVANKFDLCLNTIFEHWICSSGLTDKHTGSVLFRNTARLNLQFDMLYLNAGFSLVVRTINTARCITFTDFDMCKQRSNTLFRFQNTLVQFCGEHAG